jgi:hypothetical protein
MKGMAKLTPRRSQKAERGRSPRAELDLQRASPISVQSEVSGAGIAPKKLPSSRRAQIMDAENAEMLEKQHLRDFLEFLEFFRLKDGQISNKGGSDITRKDL